MGLLDLCAEYFGTQDFYDVLNINNDANKQEIKTGYYRTAMTVHPDKVEQDEILSATEKFKVLAQVHNILSDPQKKKMYDETGAVSEDCDEPMSDWYEYWRRTFSSITLENLEDYKIAYIGSEEEREDVKNAYLRYRGCLNRMYSGILYMSCESESRIIEIVKKMIANNELPEYKIFTEEPEAKREARHEKYKRDKIERGDEELANLEEKIKTARNQRAAKFFAKWEKKEAINKKKVKATRRLNPRM